jgi:hypothetical protein
MCSLNAFFHISWCFTPISVCAGAIVLVCIAVPWVLPTLVPLLAGFAWVRRRYITTSREVKRFDAVTRSPIYASFGATLKVCA